jgi:hypothetical protein
LAEAAVDLAAAVVSVEAPAVAVVEAPVVAVAEEAVVAVAEDAGKVEPTGNCRSYRDTIWRERK